MIEKHIKKTKQIGIYLLLALFFIACNSEEVYDFPGTDVNKVFFQTATTTVNGYDKYNGAIILTPFGTSVSVDVKIPVHSTMMPEKEVTVNLSVDYSLVDAYNKKNGTELLKFPSDIVVLENSKLVIPAHAKLSTMFAKVLIVEEKVAAIQKGKYLVPVTISSTEGSNIQISENRNTIFVEIEVIEDDDNIADGKIPDGTSSLDRTSWSGTFAPEADWEDGTFAALFDGIDGDYYNMWNLYFSKDSSLTIDMKQVQKGITGFYLNEMIPSAKLWYSVDGVDWVLLGSTGPKQVSALVALHGAIDARYIRWDISSKRGYCWLMEFNVYTK